MAGKLSFTTNGDLDRPVHDLSFESFRIRFAVTDDAASFLPSKAGWLRRRVHRRESRGKGIISLGSGEPSTETSPDQPVRRLSRGGRELKEL